MAAAHVSNLECLEKPQKSMNMQALYPGSVVKCVTCHGNEIQGEVLAYDCEKKVVIMSKY